MSKISEVAKNPWSGHLPNRATPRFLSAWDRLHLLCDIYKFNFALSAFDNQKEACRQIKIWRCFKSMIVSPRPVTKTANTVSNHVATTGRVKSNSLDLRKMQKKEIPGACHKKSVSRPKITTFPSSPRLRNRSTAKTGYRTFPARVRSPTVAAYQL